MSTLAYSPSAYVAIALMRTRRTLLVEGVNDQRFMYRLLVEINGGSCAPKADLLIDSAEMIRDCPGIFSNREKVEYIHSLVSDHDKLGAWVDREFRLFVVDRCIQDELSAHNVLYNSLFWTRGHSVENYFFDTSIVLRYLEQLYPEHLPANYKQSIESVMDDLTRYAASLSLAAKELNLISRVSALFSTEHWTIVPGMKISINEDILKQSVCQRGVEEKQAGLYIERFRKFHEISGCTQMEPCRWIAHGHIGSSVIWSGVAATLAHCGMKERSLVGKISQGDWEHKHRLGADIWSKATATGTATSPLQLVEWMKANQCASRVRKVIK